MCDLIASNVNIYVRWEKERYCPWLYDRLHSQQWWWSGEMIWRTMEWNCGFVAGRGTWIQWSTFCGSALLEFAFRILAPLPSHILQLPHRRSETVRWHFIANNIIGKKSRLTQLPLSNSLATPADTCPRNETWLHPLLWCLPQLEIAIPCLRSTLLAIPPK